MAQGDGPLFEDFKHGVVLEAGDEENTLAAPRAEEAIVVVATIHGDDRSRVERQQSCSRNVMTSGLTDVHERGQILIVVEQHVNFDASLGSAEPSPRKQRQAQRDGGRIEREQLVLETEAPRPQPKGMPRSVLNLGGSDGVT